MPTRDSLGGVVHTYKRYDPVAITPPRPAQTDLASAAMEHLLEFGSLDELEFTPEQMADAIVLDPEQIRGLGPSLDAIQRKLEEMRRQILERYEAETVRKRARKEFRESAAQASPPPAHREAFERAVHEEQLRRLERLWYAQQDDQGRFATDLVKLTERLGTVYQIDELATKWTFTGREKLSIAEALAVKEELEEIERLLQQLKEARQNARVVLIDMEALGQFLEAGELDELDRLRRQVEQAIQ